jgi:hypothetical protein
MSVPPHFPRFRLASRLPSCVLSLCACLFVACAAPVRDPWGVAIARGESVAPRLPASFQADLGVRPHAAGSLPFSARLYGEAHSSSDSAVRASRRYRLDVFGFPSAVMASWVWNDGNWLLVRHDMREAISGEGIALGAEDSPVRIPDVPAVLGVLAGEPLPGYPGTGQPVADSGGIVRWYFRGEPWRARIDPDNGLCRKVESPSLALLYARHHLHDGVVVPDEIQVLADGDTLLSLSVRDWKASPAWKKDPFNLGVPVGYERK